jgi:hypothetical protein
MKHSHAWFPTSTAVLMRSPFFCAVTQRSLVVSYWRLGTTYRSHLQGLSSPRRFLSKRLQVTMYLRCVTSPKNEGLKQIQSPKHTVFGIPGVGRSHERKWHYLQCDVVRTTCGWHNILNSSWQSCSHIELLAWTPKKPVYPWSITFSKIIKN